MQRIEYIEKPLVERAFSAWLPAISKLYQRRGQEDAQHKAGAPPWRFPQHGCTANKSHSRKHQPLFLLVIPIDKEEQTPQDGKKRPIAYGG